MGSSLLPVNFTGVFYGRGKATDGTGFWFLITNKKKCGLTVLTPLFLFN